MDISSRTIALVVFAVVSVLLQCIVAPAIAVGSIVPNFILGYCLTIAIIAPDAKTPVWAFVLGIVYDLLGNCAIGSLSLCLVIAAYLMSKLFDFLDTDNHFMPVVMIAISCLLVDVVYALIMALTLDGVGVFGAIVYRALPCALYDLVVGCVLYFVIGKVCGASSTPTMPGRIKYR